MTLTLTIPAFVYLVATVLGTIITIISWSYPYTERSYRLLGTSVFSVTWISFIFFLSESQLIYSVPHLFQTSLIGGLLYLPFTYLFVRSNVCGNGLTWKDLIHVLPLAVFLVDYSVIYFLPASEKLQLIAADRNSVYQFNEGWLFSGSTHRTSRLLLFITYSGLQFNLALRSKDPSRRRILYYLAAQFLMVFYYFYFVYQLADDPLAWRSVSVVLSACLVVIAVSLMLHPHILYDLKEPVSSIAKEKIAGRRNLNNEKRVEQICRRLETYMTSESPYLRQGYSLSELSAALNIPSYQLSAILNQYIKLSFQEYLNKHRIAYCKNRILDGAAELITLEALAYECGFNNRNSFTAAFKQFSGTTPSDFLKAQRNHQPAAKVS